MHIINTRKEVKHTVSNIKPISDLRNYTEVLALSKSKSVYISHEKR